MQLIKYSLAFFIFCTYALPQAWATGPEKHPFPEKQGELLFVKNLGQVADNAGKPSREVLYSTRAQGLNLFVRADGLAYQFDRILTEYPKNLDPNLTYQEKEDLAVKTHQQYRFDMRLKGANPNPRIREEAKQAYLEHFYLGHCPDGIENVPSFKRLVFEEVYPHIDWVIYAQGATLKYDFILRPGADPAQIRLEYIGADSLKLLPDGRVRIFTPMGSLDEKAPLSLQAGQAIESAFEVLEKGLLGFKIGTYDTEQILTIDPILEWSTYYGGAGNDVCLSIDTEGSFLYIGGQTSSVGLGTTGVFRAVPYVGDDGFITKWTYDGQRLWTTYIGGAEADNVVRIAVQADGVVFIAGRTASTGMATAGVHKTTRTSTLMIPYLGRFTTAGLRNWVTYFTNEGGNTSVEGFSLDKTIANPTIVYLAGSTQETVGISTSNSHLGNWDAYVAAFNTSNGTQSWGAYYGGTAADYCRVVRVSQGGGAPVIGGATNSAGFLGTGFGGQDGFVALAYNGGSIDGYRVGGAGTDNVDDLVATYTTMGLAVSYVIHLVMSTNSTSDIATAGAYQVTKSTGFDASIMQVNYFSDPFLGGATWSKFWATYYGGPHDEFGPYRITRRGQDLYVSFGTNANNGSGWVQGGWNPNFVGPTYPYSPFPLACLVGQPCPINGDAVLAKFGATGAFRWSTYFTSTRPGSIGEGETIHGLITDPFGNLYMTGSVRGPNIELRGSTFQSVYNGGTEGVIARYNGANSAILVDTLFRQYDLCPGAQLTVPIKPYGMFTPNYTVELSNNLGSFASPIVLPSTLAANQVQFTLPAATLPGAGYRLRFSTPTPTGTISYTTDPINLTNNCINLTPNQGSYCDGQVVTLTLPRVPASPTSINYNWTAAGQTTSGTSPFTLRTLNGLAPFAPQVNINNGMIVQGIQPRVVHTEAPFIEDLGYQLCDVASSANLQIRALNSLPCPDCPMELIDSMGGVVQTWVGLPATRTVTVAGVYSARIQGCGQSNAVRVRRVILGPSIQVLPSDTVCGGSSATLQVAANCSACTYLWSTGQTTSDIVVTPVGPSNNYSVTVSESASATACQAVVSRIVYTRAPAFDSIRFLPIANSEGLVPLDSIFRDIFPLTSQSLQRTYSDANSRVSGSPGLGFFFDVRGATPGLHPITVRVFENGCFAERVAQIQVIAPPQLPVAAGFLDTIYCRSGGDVLIERDLNYAYGNIPGLQSIERNVMFAEFSNYSGIPVSNNANTAQETYTFDPTLTVGQSSQVRIFYRSYIYIFDAFGSLVGTRSYIVGSRTVNVRVTDNVVPNIVDRPSQYCERDEFRRVRLSPADGQGTALIQQMSGPGLGATVQRAENFLPNSLGEIFFNPSVLDIDNTDSYYRLIFTYDNNGCGGADTVAFFLPEPADSSFTPITGTAFCVSVPAVTLMPVTPGGSFTVGTTSIPDGIFRPSVLGPGTYTVRYDVSNNFGCFYNRTQTYRVDSLPSLSLAGLPTQFCPNHQAYTINPSVNLPAGGRLSIWRAGDSILANNLVNNVNIPHVFNPASVPSIPAASEDLIFRYNFTDGNGCSNVVTRTARLSPRPAMSLNLAPGTTTFCAGSLQSATPLNPSPFLVTIPLTSSANNGNFNQANNVYTPINVVTGDVITYIYEDPVTTCRDTLIRTINVVSSAGLPAVTFTTTVQPVYCRDSFLSETIGVTVGGAAPAAGQGNFFTSTNAAAWQANGTNTAATFRPHLAGTGNVGLFYTYTHTGPGGCAVTIAQNTTVRSLPDLQIVYAVPANAPNNQFQVCQKQGDSIELIPFDQRFPPVVTASYSFSGPGILPSNFLSIDSAFTPQITLILTDVNGCRDTLVDSIRILDNPRPLINGLDSSYCLNSPIDTVLGLPAGGTWTTVPNDYLFSTPTVSFFLPRGPLGTFGPDTVLLSYEVVYPNQCVNREEVSVRVAAPPSLNITRPLAAQTICQNEIPFLLEATADGLPVTTGFFYEGVIGGIVNDTFYPAAALPNRNIFFTYRDTLTNCADTTSIQVTVLRKPQAAMASIDPAYDAAYCVDSPRDTFRDVSQVFNPGPRSRTFFTSAPNTQSFLPTSDPERASFSPTLAGVGSHNLSMIAFDAAGCADTVHLPVTVVPLPQGVGVLPFDSVLCVNEGPTEVRGIPVGGGNFRILSPAGQVVQNSGATSVFDINPQTLTQGFYNLVYAHTDLNGCTNYDSTTFEVHPQPMANYQQLTFCVGDTILVQNTSTFNNPLNAADTTRFSFWRYQGLLRPNNSPRLSLFGLASGWGALELVTESGAGCRDTLASAFLNSNQRRGDTIFVYGVPRVKFLEEGGCQFDLITFTPDSTGLQGSVSNVLFDRISRIRWAFGTGDTLLINNPGGVNLPPVTYTYTQPGVYFPRLEVVNNGYCRSEDSIRIVIAPTFNPVQVPYSQDFEANSAQWFQSLADNQAVWTWGSFQSARIPAFQGKNWSTQGGQAYDAGLATWVYTPCFDLRQSQRPMLKFDYFADLYPFDGVVLEFYERDRQRWRTLGAPGKGLNWYNNEENVFGLLNFKPLAAWSTLDAWTGYSFDWKNARYRLDSLKGQNFVRFRFALGTLPNVPNNDRVEGFALDNFWLGERRRNVLVEHFANVFFPGMNNINQQVYGRVSDPYNGNDVYLIQYHTNQTSAGDPIFDLNTPDHSARRFYYGAEDAKAVVNGNVYYGPSTGVLQDDLDSLMLQDPAFRINLQPVRITAGTLDISADIEALSNLPNRDYVVYATVVEDSVRANGQTMYGVMRKFIPNHGALRYSRAWAEGDTLNIRQAWFINSNTYRPNMLQAIVFIQNDSTKEVLQVAATRNINFFPTLSTSPAEVQTPPSAERVFSLNAFPNPASYWLQAEFNLELETEAHWDFFDLQGRQLFQGHLQAGTKSWTIQVQDLPAGLYLLRVLDPQTGASAVREIIIRRD